MKCLYCECTESKVIDSRSADDDKTIRRRRECIACGRRFTTYETIEVTPILVVKNNGTRQSYNAEKVRNGIIKSCEKRPVSITVIDDMVADISKQVYNSMESEIIFIIARYYEAQRLIIREGFFCVNECLI